jgi:hypothetical protein
MIKNYNDIELHRQFKLYDKITILTSNDSYFGRIISLSEVGLMLKYNDELKFIEWKEILNTCGHGY